VWQSSPEGLGDRSISRARETLLDIASAPVDLECNEVTAAIIAWAGAPAIQQLGNFVAVNEFEVLLGSVLAGASLQGLQLEKDVVWSCFKRSMSGNNYRVGEAERYVPPDAVTDVPGRMTPTELVTALETRGGGDAGGWGTLPNPSPLASEVDSFFAGSSQQVLLVVGEPGAGKSVFTWLQAQRVADAGWVPVVLDLKEHKVSTLAGALPRHLQRCGVPDPTVTCLARGTPPPGHTAPVKLAVFCDGFDQLQIDVRVARSALQDLAGTLCGGPGAAWPAAVLRVVVTTRGSALTSAHDEATVFYRADGTKHARCVVLPFSDTKVR
jgi:hypothetical protein